MKQIEINREYSEQLKNANSRKVWLSFENIEWKIGEEFSIILRDDTSSAQSSPIVGVGVVDQIVQKRLSEITQEEISTLQPGASREDFMRRWLKDRNVNGQEQLPATLLYYHLAKDGVSKEDAAGVFPEKVVIYTDGGSRGNPGPSASGYAIFDTSKNLLVRRGVYLGITTNNQAEYTAVKLALEEAKKHGTREVTFYMDSMLVANQMNGIYKIKNRDLWPIHQAITELRHEFHSVSFTQVPRALNKIADAIVNESLDKQANVN